MSEADVLQSPKRRSLRRQSQTPLALQPTPVNCPRCESTNTKFCYFNNYNKTQPRYFCRACKRHWTKGGTLRNVPIGGGRKNKRRSRPYITATAAAIRNNPSIDQDTLLPELTDPEETSVVSEASFLQTIDSERGDQVESYTDIEELKGLVSWDFYESFLGCRMQELGHEDLPRLGFSKLSSSFEMKQSSNILKSCTEILKVEDETIATNMIIPSSSQQTSSFLELNYWNLNDLDDLEDLNKLWEDPTFRT